MKRTPLFAWVNDRRERLVSVVVRPAYSWERAHPFNPTKPVRPSGMNTPRPFVLVQFGQWSPKRSRLIGPGSARRGGILAVLMLYAVVAIAWLALPDRLLHSPWIDPDRIVRVGIVKGVSSQ